MGKALYRKYRSRSLSEIVGQEHITTTLHNAMKSGKISHAYLLTGPRGVGKTSIARILAYEINQLPYSEDPHFDIIEIDAASNNGVEDIRDLREKILSSPTSAKYKVFIIDEVHMLSKAAFNALLKTLEEPPAHVVFILATTEAHKLPETIISRTQRYGFRPVPLAQVEKHLQTIAEKEGITIADEALTLIAEHGQGSFRDSISLLDQSRGLGSDITKEQVESLLGRPPSSQIRELTNYIYANDGVSVLQITNELLDQGYEPGMIAVQLGQQVRGDILNMSTQRATDAQLHLLRDLLDIPPAHNPRAMLEVVLLRQSLAGINTDESLHPKEGSNGPVSTTRQESGPKRADKAAKDTPKTKLTPDNNSVSPANPVTPKGLSPQQPAAAQTLVSQKEAIMPVASDQKTSVESELPIAEAPQTTKTSIDGYDSSAAPVQDVDELWQSVLEELKKTHNTLYGIARMAKPKFVDGDLRLELNFAFHTKRLSEPTTSAIINKIVDQKRQSVTKLTFITVDKAAPKDDTITTISNIFGGAELLES